MGENLDSDDAWEGEMDSRAAAAHDDYEDRE